MLADQPALGIPVGSTGMGSLHRQRLPAQAHFYSAVPDHGAAKNATGHLDGGMPAHRGYLVARTQHLSPDVRLYLHTLIPAKVLPLLSSSNTSPLKIVLLGS